ncbi:hypothetical protein [Cryobacterium sp. W22_MBD10_FK3]|uniref:hypothetical protein n=1 Tax=Cryobacterium sp. W22_MBD10_FK3 TaxID=3240273 RepID=UPI003F917B27
MLRIRKKRWKIAYIVIIGVGLLAFLNGAVVPRLFSDPLSSVMANVFVVLVVFGGVRSFRGSDEPIEPPRAWWRMTSRPRAGFVLGALLILNLANSVFGVVSGSTDPQLTGVLSAVVDALLAFLYISSSIRLVRDPPQIERQHIVHDLPRWAPLKR